VENLWTDLNVKFLKTPSTLKLSVYEQNQIVAKISEIEKKALALKEKAAGIEASYWRINAEFAKFLKKKLDVLQSKQAWQLFKGVSLDINTASKADCNKLLSFEQFSEQLSELLELAQKNNLLVNGFVRSYGNRASDYNIERFRIDTQGLTELIRKAKIATLLGKECMLYFSSKEFFEELTIKSVDCNALADLSKSIYKVEKLASDAKALLNELATYDVDIKPLLADYSKMKNTLNELKTLYEDINSC
jgi:uncharacterized coiled-coil DUF342 family protein